MVLFFSTIGYCRASNTWSSEKLCRSDNKEILQEKLLQGLPTAT